jgi:hypothetical protein
MMSSYGPPIEPEVLRKNVSGMVSGFSPESLTWLAKFVIWATTRQGALTGETSARVAGSTTELLAPAAWIFSGSARSAAVVAAPVSTRAAPVGVWTHQASAVRRTVVLMIPPPSTARGGG